MREFRKEAVIKIRCLRAEERGEKEERRKNKSVIRMTKKDREE